MSQFKGILLVVAASIAYGAMPIFTKDLLMMDMSTSMVVFFRYFLAALTSFVYIKIRKYSLELSKKQMIDVLFLGTAGFGLTGFLLSASYRYIPVGLATMFHFIYPLFVMVIMIIIFHEKIDKLKIISVLLAIFGLFLLADLNNANIKTIGLILALFSGLTYAVYIVGVNQSELKNLRLEVMIFYVTFVSSIIIAVQLIIKHDFYVIINTKTVIDFLFISQVSTVFALFMLVSGIKIVGETKASILNMLEPIVSVILGIIILSETFNKRILFGCVLVILAAVLLTKNKENKKIVCNAPNTLSFTK